VLDLAGKVAFVTGGDSGIGLGITQALLNADMKVAITYRSRTHLNEAMELLRAPEGRLHAINVDVTDYAALEAAAAETTRIFNKVHVLINNAGVALMLPLSQSTAEDWTWCMSINATGVFNGIRAFLPHLRAHGEGGHIVATASMLGGLVAGPLWGVYSASKFAVVGMLEALRAELEGTNIGVSIFCPAGVRTNLGTSDRNRPAALATSGVPDERTRMLLNDCFAGMTRILENAGPQAVMEPMAAAECLLKGIRNNDLYILSHPEYEPTLRDRCEALLASVPEGSQLPAGRVSMAEFLRCPMYVDEAKRRKRAAYE
jgi:NAD(P)-dependent dehydrogenase (short-subunit alcohol dehydrogenase family)